MLVRDNQRRANSTVSVSTTFSLVVCGQLYLMTFNILPESNAFETKKIFKVSPILAVPSCNIFDVFTDLHETQLPVESGSAGGAMLAMATAKRIKANLAH